MKRSVRIVVVAVAAFALQGCSGGMGSKFTESECETFTTKWFALSGMASSGILEPSEVEEMRTGLVQECVAGKIGLSREELECGNKANGLDEFRACNIVIRG